MFRRDAAGVTDLHSLRREMRYNDYETDKVQMGVCAVVAACSTRLSTLCSSKLPKISAALCRLPCNCGHAMLGAEHSKLSLGVSDMLQSTWVQRSNDLVLHPQHHAQPVPSQAQMPSLASCVLSQAALLTARPAQQPPMRQRQAQSSLRGLSSFCSIPTGILIQQCAPEVTWPSTQSPKAA